jgi:hypothetical protein
MSYLTYGGNRAEIEAAIMKKYMKGPVEVQSNPHPINSPV